MLRGSTRLLQPWRTSSRMTYKSSSATSDVSPAPFRLAHHPGYAAVPPRAARQLSAWQSNRAGPGAPRHRQVAPLR
jgi:hypothetical protein